MHAHSNAYAKKKNATGVTRIASHKQNVCCHFNGMMPAGKKYNKEHIKAEVSHNPIKILSYCFTVNSAVSRR